MKIKKGLVFPINSEGFRVVRVSKKKDIVRIKSIKYENEFNIDFEDFESYLSYLKEKNNTK